MMRSGDGEGGESRQHTSTHVDLIPDPRCKARNRWIARRIRREVTVVELIFVVNDQNADVQLKLFVAVGDRESNIAGLISITALPEAHGVLPERGCMPRRVCISVIMLAEGGRCNTSR